MVVPFVVPTQNLPYQFYQAMDWTSFTENGNTTPDWWLFYFYGTTALLDSSLDSQGNPLVSDYLAGTDPNLISFTVAATNNEVNQSLVPVQVNVTAGLPSYYAVLVNDPNPSDANWQAYPGAPSR